MSNQFVPAPDNPDGRIFASYPMPAKLDLLNERPRRESLLEQQLEHKIGEQISVPSIEVSGARTPTPDTQTTSMSYSGPTSGGHSVNREYRTVTTTTTVNTSNQDPYYWNRDNNQLYSNEQSMVHQQPSTSSYQQSSILNSSPTNYMDDTSGARISNTNSVTTNQVKTGVKPVNNAAILAADLAEKESKLMAAINALHSRPYSPFQVPEKIDLTNEGRALQQQYQNAPSPRNSSSRASSRSASANADFLDKEAKLLQEIEEIERKPYNPQTMVVEREKWYEYPQGRPHEKHLTDSKRRVKDFCSLPEHMYSGQDRHFHEEDIPIRTHSRTQSPNTMHTVIFRSPQREVDNKSPLPFAFDNFSTKGVRGNIASVGAVEPDRPRPPIYPIIKRTPSPSGLRT